jgi:hypothetical protein
MIGLYNFTDEMCCIRSEPSFPRAILHGPLLLGGMGIPSLLQKNAKDRLNYFLFNVQHPSTISINLKYQLYTHK